MKTASLEPCLKVYIAFISQSGFVNVFRRLRVMNTYEGRLMEIKTGTTTGEMHQEIKPS